MRSFLLGIILAACATTLIRLASTPSYSSEAREREEQRQREEDLIRTRASLAAERSSKAEEALYDAACRSIDALDRTLTGTRAELAQVKTDLANTIRVRDTVQAELLASQDRLDKAYRDIAEFEVQIVDVCRKYNELRDFFDGSPHNPPPTPLPRALTKAIQGKVLGVSESTNLILISVGTNDEVGVGMVFRVVRGELLVGELQVDRVDDTWSACRRVGENRKEPILQGDSVERGKLD